MYYSGQSEQQQNIARAGRKNLDPHRVKSVKFADSPPVVFFVEGHDDYPRAGTWRLDAQRFHQRITDSEIILKPVLLKHLSSL